MLVLNQADGERMAFIQPRAQGCRRDVSVYFPVLQHVFGRDQQKFAVPGLSISALGSQTQWHCAVGHSCR